MRIYTTMVPSADSGEIWKVDTIEFQGEFWLVTRWLESPSQQKRRPLRIIRLFGLQFQQLPPGNPFGDFLLQEPMPKALFADQLPSPLPGPYVVIEMPEITFPYAGGLQ